MGGFPKWVQFEFYGNSSVFYERDKSREIPHQQSSYEFCHI